MKRPEVASFGKLASDRLEPSLCLFSYGTVLRRLRAYDARIPRRKLERSTRSQSTVQQKTQSTC